MKTLVIVHLLLLVLGYCYGKGHVVICREREKEALLKLKGGLIDVSGRLSSWDSNTNCCEAWAGVVCNNLAGHVVQLHLQNPHYVPRPDGGSEYQVYERSKLGGKISASLVELKHLKHLDLSLNDFGGIPIPSFLGSLTTLQYLNLSEAGFRGTVPPQLGNLTTLRSLSLRAYYDELNVERLEWLAGLSSLEHLDLNGVNLNNTPDWPQVMSMLPSLVELHLSNCALSSISPLLYPNFSSLAVLDLSDNQFGYFSMPLPGWIFSLTNLVSLDVSGNHFDGPSLPANVPCNLTSLEALDVSHNFLNFSSLPKWVFSLNGLLSLNLRVNRFEGPIPIALSNLTSLTDLDMSYNSLNSTIPDWLYSMRRLESLHLWYNALQGTVSSAIGNLTSLVTLDLSDNQLEGRVSKAVGSLCNLKEIDLSRNKIEGEISEFFEAVSGCTSNGLESVQLGENQFFGQLPHQLEQFKSLQHLSVYANSISGPIPPSLGSLSSLTLLDLSRNQLNGSLPESLGQLSTLEQLRISYNQLEGVVSVAHFVNLANLRELDASSNRGLVLDVSRDWIPPFQCDIVRMGSWNLGDEFPSWLRTQSYLKELDLSSSGISNAIPHWLWNLSNSLYYLNLSHNQFHSGIPHNLSLNYQITNTIDLSSNHFSGPLPRIHPNVSILDLSNNSFSGDVSHFLCDNDDTPRALEILNLGYNMLSGQIPDCWTNWTSLMVIRLEGNNLTGTVPNSMGLLFRLESLHLRNNSLSGEIPLSPQNCTELRVLDLSDNQLAGSVPEWMGEGLLNLIVFSCSSNKLHGQIPPQICGLTSLQILDLSNNHLSGPIPQSIHNFTTMRIATPDPSLSPSIAYASVTGLFIGTGTVVIDPEANYFLESAFVVTKGRGLEYSTILRLLTSINLSDNNIYGEIPVELTTLLGLRSLNLSRNRLEGRIPEKIGDMMLLESIDLSRNILSGEIPTSMASLNFLSHLNVSSNKLTGKIPLGTQLQGFNQSCFAGNSLCGSPLLQNCSLRVGVTVTNDVEGKVDWHFYTTAAFGFVVGFWGVFGPLIFHQPWRRLYFVFLDNTWERLCTLKIKIFSIF